MRVINSTLLRSNIGKYENKTSYNLFFFYEEMIEEGKQLKFDTHLQKDSSFPL